MVIEYTYYQHTNNVLHFEWKWGVGGALVTVCVIQEIWFLIGNV